MRRGTSRPFRVTFRAGDPQRPLTPEGGRKTENPHGPQQRAKAPSGRLKVVPDDSTPSLGTDRCGQLVRTHILSVGCQPWLLPDRATQSPNR